MRRTPRLMLVILTAVLMPMCMGSSCGRDMRDAALGGAMDYVSGTSRALLDSMLPLPDLWANWFAGPTGGQDQ